MAGNKQTRIVDVRVTSNVDKTMKKGTKSAKGLGGALKGVATSANLATGGIRAMTMALLSSGVGAIVVALGGLISLLTSSARKGAEFEQSLANLQAVSGATNRELELLKMNARELGRTTQFTAAQVAELQTEFARLGFTTPEILNVTEATLDLALATGTDLAEAAAVAGSTLRGFGLDSQETGRVANVMANSFSKSALDMEKFRESMKMVAPVAATAKVSIEEASAALSVLANVGISGSMAGTSLRKIMSDLAKETGKDFATSLEITAERLANATSEQEKFAIAQDLVGDRAYTALIALAENKDMVADLTDEYTTNEEALAKMAAIMENTVQGKLKAVNSAWEGLLLSFSDPDGILTNLQKNILEFFANQLNKLTMGVFELQVEWIGIVGAFEKGGLYIKSMPTIFQKLWLGIKEFAIESKLALAGVPFIGDGIDKEKAERELKEIDEQQKKVAKILDNFRHDLELKDAITEAKQREKRKQQTQRIAAQQKSNRTVVDEFREADVSSDDDANKTKLENRKKFLEKLADLEKKAQAKTEAEKIEYNRQKHLDELARIEKETGEMNEARDRVNAIYDKQRKDLEDKRKEDLRNEMDSFFVKNMQDEESRRILENEMKEEEFIAKLEKLGADEAQINEVKAEFRRQRKAINDGFDEQEKQAEREKMAAIVDMTSSNLGALANIATAFAGKSEKSQKKAFQISKKLRMAQAVVSGINAVQSAYSHGSTLGGPVLGAIQAAIAGAATAANVAAIAKTTFQGGGQQSNTSNVRAVQPPAFNVIGQTSADGNMIADSIGRSNSQPIKAYVVEGEVSSAQELGRKTQGIAELG